MKKLILLGSFLGASICFAQEDFYDRPVINLASDGVSNSTIEINEGAVFYDANKTKSVIRGSNDVVGGAPLCSLKLLSSSDTQSFNSALKLQITAVTGTAINPENRTSAIVVLQLSKLYGHKTEKVATLTCVNIPVTSGYSFETGSNINMVTIKTLNNNLGDYAKITMVDPLIFTEVEPVVEPKKGKN
ncbi:MAG: hypothetical protein QE271_00175 [Bacteriovoracaceae bacterium]|nr:hypothetical protein [Bacteriovoracaceae bacterium]